MEHSEAQMRAIKLSGAQASGEAGAHDDMEGRIHSCPNCGHEMPMDEVLGRAGGERLTHSDEEAEDAEHMDKEGREHKHR